MTSKKKLYRILGIFAIIVLLGYFVVFVFFPMMISGPSSLYFISNHDIKNHTIAIKILDSHNKAVLHQSYGMQPDSTMQYPRGFGWYPTVTWTPLTWSEGTYTFNAVLDNGYTISHTTNVQLTQTIFISITSNAMTPVEISEVWA